eukprot:GGOE01018490.1.p1 GENE.GGOE01018490.1~~GGOE01018490.1.p1  ORF type:complete len:468 (+),score=141.79 GGOE01018490.1:57-1460(+)
MYTFAGQEYSFRLPDDAPPYVTACLANDVAGVQEFLASGGIDVNACEATVLFSEMEMEFEESFTLLFLSVLAGAVEVAALLIDAGASTEDVADLAKRAFQHIVGDGAANTASFEASDLNRLRLILAHTSRHHTVKVSPEHFIAEEGTAKQASALLWVGCMPGSLSVPLPSTEALVSFCGLLGQLAPDVLSDLNAPRCLQWARDIPNVTPISEAAWVEGAVLVHEEVADVRFTDVAVAFLFLAGEEAPLRHAIHLCQTAAVPIAWAPLYYTSQRSTSPCFQLLFQSGCGFFLQGLPSRAAELCHKVGPKLKVFDSRMEKFCEVQLPLLPEDWQCSFVRWWDEKITAEGLIPPEDDAVVEDTPLCLHVIRTQRASLDAQPTPAESLDLEFQARAEAAKRLTKLPDQQRLKLYGLFKQATEGDCSVPCPGFFDFVGRAKWDAWKVLGGTAKREAMEQYVALVAQLLQQPG